jgi:adenosylmethionine-8-amino-7-oxononanoate aminotransferase
MIKSPKRLSTKYQKEVNVMKAIDQALQTIWYPCSQMKDYQSLPPIFIKQASGSILYDQDDRPIIDAISSWWCKSLGHRHPELQQAIFDQMEKFEHIIGTNTVSQALTDLSLKLTQLHKPLNKVFYTGDGSCAVEVAMKMSLHSRKILDQNRRHQFVSLGNSYHGETLATLSVSDVGIYKSAYDKACFPCLHLAPLPYVNHIDDQNWNDASDAWHHIEPQLNAIKHKITAIIVEPILQGAGGMKIYSADFLHRLASFAKAHDIHLIADEIMTGFGRTGKTLAIEHARIEPDFICLSKSLTAGTLGMSAILTSQNIYDLFYDDYETGKSFLHSNTYGGNALAAAVANKTLEIYQRDNINQKAQQLGQKMLQGMQTVMHETSAITNLRHIGAMVAADLRFDHPRAGFEVFKHAIKLGAFLRPLGNTLYWLPPLNTPDNVIDQLTDITIQSLQAFKHDIGSTK